MARWRGGKKTTRKERVEGLRGGRKRRRSSKIGGKGTNREEIVEGLRGGRKRRRNGKIERGGRRQTRRKWWKD